MPIQVRANPSRVTWNLFRPVSSIPDTEEEAQINPEMSPLENVRPERVNGRFRLPPLTLTVGINAANTMVLQTAIKTSELLEHEQGHFDLLLAVTRALARDLEAIQAPSVQSLGDQLEKAKSLHEARAGVLDAAYDRETEHSRNRAAQRKWDAAIAQALRDPRASKIVGLPL